MLLIDPVEFFNVEYNYTIIKFVFSHPFMIFVASIENMDKII